MPIAQRLEHHAYNVGVDGSNPSGRTGFDIILFIIYNTNKNLDLNMPKISKKILSYPAVFEPAKEGGYNVSFPSFPGCVTFGKTFEEAKKMASEVLELWLEELAEEKIKIPAFRSRPIIDEVSVKVPSSYKISYAPDCR